MKVTIAMQCDVVVVTDMNLRALHGIILPSAVAKRIFVSGHRRKPSLRVVFMK
jgi:hypothetical protein